MFPNPVPVPIILAVVFNVVVAFGLPIVGIVMCRKQGAKLRYFFLGAVVFTIFVMVLESAFHQLVFSVCEETLMGNTALYALYGGLAAAAFEEVGRFLAMKFFMKKDLTRENGLMYGVGHGGMEAILLVGIAYISNLVAIVMISSGAMEASLAAADEAARQAAIQQLSGFWTTGAGMVAVSGYERILAVILHICLSYFVYRAVKSENWKYFWKAFALHFLVDAATVVMVKYMSIYALEAVLTVVMCLIVLGTVRQIRQEDREKAAPAEE